MPDIELTPFEAIAVEVEAISVVIEQATVNQVQAPMAPAVQIVPSLVHLIDVSVQGAQERLIVSDLQSAETDSAIVAGQPLYLKQNGHADLASAAAIGTARVCGLAVANALAATGVSYSPDDVIELVNWTAVTGTATLTPGTTYYLSSVPGKLTTAAPTQSGQVVIAVGTALSSSRLAIEIQSPILL